MRYLKNETFTNHDGNAEDLGVLLGMFAKNYQPLPDYKLTVDDIRVLNEARDVLEQGADEDGYLVFESSPFNRLKATTLAMMLTLTVGGRSFALSAPIVEDLLDAAPKEKPSASKVTDIKEAAGD